MSSKILCFTMILWSSRFGLRQVYCLVLRSCFFSTFVWLQYVPSSTVYTVILSIWTSSGFVSFYFLFCIALDTATSGPEPSPETQSGRVYCPPGALKVPAAAKVWLGLPAQVVHATATCLLPRCTRTGAQSNTYVLLLAQWWCDPMRQWYSHYMHGLVGTLMRVGPSCRSHPRVAVPWVPPN